jgi:hypothetical protein
MFGRMTLLFRVVEDAPPNATAWDQPSDAWDIPIWTAAKRGEADFVVTANLADGPPRDAEGNREFEGVTFIHPDEFLAFLEFLADALDGEELTELAPGSSEQQSDLSPSIRQFLAELIARKFGPAEP